MKIEDIMCRDVVRVLPSTPLKDVARLLLEHRISGLPVVSDEGRVLGVVSEGDIVIKERGVVQPDAFHWLFGTDPRDGLKGRASVAAEAMTHPAVTIEPQRAVAEAARLMVARSVNRLPVVCDAKLIGIVTRADLVRAFARTDEELEHEIRDDVLLHTLWIDPTAVDISVRDGDVILDGEVMTRTDAELAGAYVARVPGVVSVDRSRLVWRLDDTHLRYGKGERRIGV